MIINQAPANLLDQLSTGILQLNQQLQFIYMNSAAESLFRISASQIIYKPIKALLLNHQELNLDLEKVLQNHQSISKRQANFILPNLQEIIVDYTITALDNNLLIEITQLDRLQNISQEDSLLTIYKTTQQLARGMAHEIKNPLGGIRGAAQLLSKTLANSQQKQFTNLIIQEVDRLKELIDKILISSSLLPHNSPINIHEVTERVYQLLTAEAQFQISIKRDYDPSIPELNGDREQLIQALLNIARNAILALKHSNTPSSEIIISTRILRNFTINGQCYRLLCEINIIDNGPGIARENIENIFYPMVSDTPGGSGLGLPIALAIVQQHHGIIKCQSQPGHTAFNIILPITNHQESLHE